MSKEVETEVMLYRVKLFCKCGREMICGKKVVTGRLTKYPHKCPFCGHTEYKLERLPALRFKAVDPKGRDQEGGK
jgi:hypothetical protein